MLDPLRVKLISESASGLVSALISPSEATRNGVRLACVILRAARNETFP